MCDFLLCGNYGCLCHILVNILIHILTTPSKCCLPMATCNVCSCIVTTCQLLFVIVWLNTVTITASIGYASLILSFRKLYVHFRVGKDNYQSILSSVKRSLLFTNKFLFLALFYCIMNRVSN